MKITLERAALLRSLSHVQSVVERRSTVPVLSNVLIRAENDTATFIATDMEIEVTETAAADIIAPGTLTASAHTLYDIVRKLPDGAQIELGLEEASGQIALISGRSRFKLGCLPVADFPKMPEGDYAHVFTLDAEALRVLIDNVRFAMSTEETRYYLNGIYVHVKETDSVAVLRAVATDGHRLARYEMPAPESARGMNGVIIPRKTILEIRKLVDETQGSVEISLSSSRIRFALGDIVITSKLIDGTFPDYERAIPCHNEHMLFADANVLGAAVDRVATISNDKACGVKIGLAQGLATLSANAPEAGSASEEMEVNYEGPVMDVGFNARYLLDVLQQIKGNGVRFAFADSAAPALVQDTSDESALYVLMPMRV